MPNSKAIAALLCFSLLGCQSTNKIDQTPEMQANRVEALQVVDCLLPGQMRMLGNQSYMTPRRPTRTTASDCGIRGGEYVAYDRSDYKTALAVWMPAAESGDANAQANVGEIFERGLGGQPNYAAAKLWYEKAASQGNKKAQFNLGTLYEQGLGVEKDMIQALEWYRLAWGVPSDELMFKSVVDQQLSETQSQLEAQQKKLEADIARKDKQIRLLEKQIRSLKDAAAGNASLADEIADLNLLVADLKTQQSTSKEEAGRVQKRLRQPNKMPEFELAKSLPTQAEPADGDYGRYFALVIGNQDYQNIDDLLTPNQDVANVSTVLEEKYGFNVIRLNDSDNITIMDAINNLNSLLNENDNLLIYYAGHGNRVKSDEFETGYWLPVNADAPPRDTLWISNEFVTRHIARIPAKRIMVIADSCYAGLLSNAPGYLMLDNIKQQGEKYIQYKKPRRSRLLLASGGDKPVLDSGGGDNSVFARALIDVLNNNQGLLTGPELFDLVRKKVEAGAKLAEFDQSPEYKVIKGAGHEMGDFFFIPKEGNNAS